MLDGAYDFALESFLDEEGYPYYFIPGVFVSVNQCTHEITSVDVEWYSWDSETEQFALLETDGERLPFFGEYDVRFSSYGIGG